LIILLAIVIKAAASIIQQDPVWLDWDLSYSLHQGKGQDCLEGTLSGLLKNLLSFVKELQNVCWWALAASTDRSQEAIESLSIDNLSTIVLLVKKKENSGDTINLSELYSSNAVRTRDCN